MSEDVEGARPGEAEETDELGTAVGTIRAAIAVAKVGGQGARITLYARLEALGGDIINLLQSEFERPDDRLTLFARRMLEAFVGRFREDSGEVIRFMLRGAPREVVAAVAKAAIEDVRHAEGEQARGFYESVIEGVRDAAVGAGAAEEVEAMYREARDGQR